ncbi:hypothetical protein HRbin12_00957 [bacterium HR12]|nr:hypothetical protein HRbin12_00957 [bacterium HR12]
MLMPSESVSVAKTTFTSPASKSSSTVSLNTGSMPAWWAATPAARASTNAPKPSARRSASSIHAARISAKSRIRAASSSVVRRMPADMSHSTLRSQPARLNTK